MIIFYKEVVILYFDELSFGVVVIGVVNIIFFENGCLIGYNIDVIGFWDLFEVFFVRLGGFVVGVLVFGMGGVVKVVVWVLE